MSSNFVYVDLGTVLGGKPKNQQVPAFDVPSEHTPKANPNFAWPSWSQDLFLWIAAPVAEPLFLTGPSGCGKTQSVKQLASLLNYPVYEVTGHNRLETPELVGHYVLRGQETVWQDGPLTSAMRTGGFFLINEVDLLDPSTAAGLNSVLDGSPLLIPDTGDVVQPHEGFRFIATANTVGLGNETGLYQGTLRMNAAFMDRFTVLEADYIPQNVEESIVLRAVPGIGQTMAHVMCDVAAHVRSLYKKDENVEDAGMMEMATVIDAPLSTRSVLRWAEWARRAAPLARKGVNVLEYSMMRAFGNRCSRPMQTALKELLQRCSPSIKEEED